MDYYADDGTRQQIAVELVARSLRADFASERCSGHDPYQVGVRDAYCEAASFALDPTGQKIGELTAEIEDATSLYCTRANVDQAAPVIVAKVAHAARHPGARPQWVGPLAFRRQSPGTLGVDHDFGDDWGELAEQRVSWRAAPGAATGLLYAYDPTWNEYAVLASDVPQAIVEAAVNTVRAAWRHPEVNALLHALDFPSLQPVNVALSHGMGPEL